MKSFSKQFMSIFILIIAMLGSCKDDDIASDDNPENGDEFLQITLDPTTQYQTIKGFGASDAWSAQFVGKNWPVAKRTQIADLLFSEDFNENGNPNGIGLGIWRFNIGAGSISQGNNSGINDEWRRAESFLTDNGYDWSAQEGQRWFVEAARQRGVNQFIGFSNSPPISLTRNGFAHSSGGSSANIDEDKHDDYASFLATVVKNYKNLYGVEFNYLSPFNEPQYDWTGGQEGSPWQNSEMANITRLLNDELIVENLNTKIQVAEAAQLNYLYENSNLSGRANQLSNFFDTSSPNYIGDLERVDQVITGHSYFTTFDTNYLINVRSQLKNEINSINQDLEFWMTEYCMIEDNADINGNGRDLGIDPALYMARLIHTDLVVANASSWQWWLAISPYDYKDGLVYIDNNKNDGQLYESKLLWGLGNYSKFIKEGYKRIRTTRSDNKNIEQSINGVLVSAYRSNLDEKFVAVVVNQRSIEIPVKMDFTDNTSLNYKVYQTSGLANDNLSFKGNKTLEDVVQIPPRSIVTFVFE